MHLAIDLREVCCPQKTGKGAWTYGFVSSLLKRSIDLTFFSNNSLPNEWNASGRTIVIRSSGLLWHMRVAQRLKHEKDVQWYLSPTSFIIPALVGKTVPCIPVVHDLIAFYGEPHEWKAQWIERLTLGRALQHAPLICTVSETTRGALLQRYPSLHQKHTVVLSAGPTMHIPTMNNVPDRRTILCTGTLCPRKNQLRLIEAFALLPETLRRQYRLLLVGKAGWKDKPIIQKARETPGVEWIGYLPDKDYQTLLGQCTILALPSLYEGFGLPLVDAMKCGIPILTTSQGALKEVAGEAALFVNPEDVRSIAQGLEKLLTNSLLRQQLSHAGRVRAEQFSWEKVVDRFLSALNTLH